MEIYQDISVEEFGEELVEKLKTIIDESLKKESSRPEMYQLFSILSGKVTSHKNRVELYCVGTGTGTTGTEGFSFLLFYSKYFEPRSISSLYSVIVWLRVLL